MVTFTSDSELTQHKPHWVPLAADLRDESKEKESFVIHFRDSFGAPIPSTLHETYSWWLAQHVESKFTVKDLPIGKQTDGFSGGILANNAASHLIDSVSHPLTQSSSDIIQARLKIFIRLADHILDRVSLSPPLSSMIVF